MLIFFDRWYKGKDVVYRASINATHIVTISPIAVEDPEQGSRIVLDPKYNDGHKHIVYTKLTVPEFERILLETQEKSNLVVAIATTREWMEGIDAKAARRKSARKR